ncbi:hypothetical protein [Tissierella creatinophila]|uniref:Hemolysin XhlA n=1 Tax=Tissierella creatinophila DSM 6911 TaxID=1123403 RepID=A0A1U7M6G2_TISCR|nr:hypothetical protein [Tissierella creatinophila]OLS02871.1 hypothetical protein TICRE_11440 [Tissierella creatinophila DSM 6911]
MDEKLCKEKHRRIDERLDINEKRLNSFSSRIDIIENDIVAQKKDTTHLQDAIKSLQKSIDLLIKEIATLKDKPLEKYEKIVMVIITAIVSYVMGKVF